MAWTAPNTFVAGAVLTAAQLNAMQANALAGGPIYATEALRDAAIPTPYEGQRAYITGSTVAAATGASAAVPTGILTVYNGSSTPTIPANWVCITPVGAFTSTAGGTTSTSYTATLSGASTNPSVTLTTGTTARISMSMVGNINVAANTMYASVAVSGATTIAAGSTGMEAAYAVSGNGYENTLSADMVIMGLTAGVNTFTLQYRNSTALATATYSNRRLVAHGVA